jgi:hypothetical protein
MSFDNLIFIKEPLLRFGHDQHAEFVKDGLLLFGPLNDPQKPVSMRVGVIGSPKGIALYKKWVCKINGFIPAGKVDQDHHVPFPGYGAVFGTQWPEEPVCTLIVQEDAVLKTIQIQDRHQAIHNTVSLYEEKIRIYLTEQEAHVDLWFVVIPEQVHQYGRPKSKVPSTIAVKAPVMMNAKLARKIDAQPSLFEADNEIAELYKYDLNFHNQLKARLLDTKAVIQVVRETTLAPEEFMVNGRPVRHMQDDASVAWSLCTTSYFKSSGRPWKLSQVREGVCYVGLVFKRDMTTRDPKNACCGAQMFLDSGDGLVFKGAVGPWYSEQTGEFHISREQAKKIAEKIIEAYKSEHGAPPTELFIHGKTQINENEWDGFI